MTDLPAAGADSSRIPHPSRFRVWLRRLRSGLLISALLAFFLPFASVSCGTPAGYGSAGGGVTANYTAYTLATGGQPDLDPFDRQRPKVATDGEDHVASQPLALAALALTVAALVFSLSSRRTGPRWVAALSMLAASTVALEFLIFRAVWSARIGAKLDRLVSDAQASQHTDASGFVVPAIGLYVLVLLLLSSAGVALVSWRTSGHFDTRSSL